MILVVTVLVVKVIPTFEPIFEEVGASLPMPTQVVLSISHFVRDYWYLIIGLVVGSVVGFIYYNSTEKGRYNIDSLKLNVPLFGTLNRKIALSRFSRAFSVCFEAGISMLASLDISKRAADNARIESAIQKARDSVNVGEKLATSLQVTEEFPALV